MPRFFKIEAATLFTTTHGRRPVSGFSKAKIRADEHALTALCDEAVERGEDAKKVAMPPWVPPARRSAAHCAHWL